jgi:glycosyltransferase involved in cell wall biosynthesis
VASQPDTVILLATYRPGALLAPQLNSYVQQSHRGWRLIVSDDSSDPDSQSDVIHALQAMRDRMPGQDIKHMSGPGRGSAQNFLHLLRAARTQDHYAALSDQDDVWLPEKLARARAALAALPADQPGLYCARTQLCKADLTPIRLSPVWPRRFGLRNALIQNIAAGNTIVLNRAGLDLALRAVTAAETSDIAAHDWWLYQLITAFGGTVLHDDQPVLLYRQHATNQMGRNDTIQAKIVRLRRIWSGEYREWVGRNLTALLPLSAQMPIESRQILTSFVTLRQAKAWQRLIGWQRLGLYRQNRRSGLILWLALLLGRL